MEHNTTEAPIDPEEDEGIVTAKVVSMIVLSVATFILGMIPTALSAWFGWNRKTDGSLDTSRTSRLILSLLICFGGGALLSTMFLHMLPEVREFISELQAESEIAETSVSLPELLMCCGFFIMYLLEELTHLYIHGHGDEAAISEADEVLHRSFSIRKCSGSRSSLEKDAEDTQKGCEDDSSLKVIHGYPSALTTSTLEEVKTNGTCTPDTRAGIPSHHVPHFKEDDTIVSSVRNFLLVLALSIHELFEGLAIGLQTSTSYVWYMLGAASSHKLVLAFCVGVELVSSRTKFLLSLMYICTFALVSPLGIGIGIGLSEGDGHGGVPNAILQGIATGTILYAVFFEVLQKEHNSKESGLLRLLAILVGFGAMLGLRIAVGHNHSHGHGDDHDHDHTTDHPHPHH
ncbi:zinc transporter ZIP1 [Cryptotermes secundus]|uniref:zinc transporter ZIP1 n=1 Tax=Cryptotermes secundus TaxID=105785 RepID=UPI000CD7ACCA|nr:zinc transporter ZIP1 [Cryptotermes secundus]